MAKPKWQPQSWANHQEFIKRANAKGHLRSDAQVISFLGLALCGEAGELANLLKKMWRGDSVSTQDLWHEIADVRIYLQHLAEHLGVDIDAACQQKVEIVAKRLSDAA